ncbi:ribonuclease H-like domain-containing protein, partial [Tanacetum coccineum]
DLSLSKSTDVSTCEVCHMAEQIREPFPFSDHKSEKLGDVVHLDFWGPYRVKSREGFKLPTSVLNGKSPLTNSHLATSVVEGSPSLSRTYVEALQLSENGATTQVEDNSLSKGNVSEITTGSFIVPTHNLTPDPIDRVEAINDEVDALYRNHTWTIVELPKGRKAIGCKWIFKIKYKVSGEIKRCLIVVAITNSWPLYQLDVNNAFLYGDLIEDVYMTLPLGFGDNSENNVCKLNKSLYGIKQAPRQRNAKLTAAFI